jgi:hypothetical protein
LTELVGTDDVRMDRLEEARRVAARREEPRSFDDL